MVDRKEKGAWLWKINPSSLCTESTVDTRTISFFDPTGQSMCCVHKKRTKQTIVCTQSRVYVADRFSAAAQCKYFISRLDTAREKKQFGE